MKNNWKKYAGTLVVSGVMIAALAGCGAKNASDSTTTTVAASAATEQVSVITETVTVPENTSAEDAATEAQATESTQEQAAETQATEAVTASANVSADGAIDASEIFTDRDLRQSADLTDATTLTLSDGEDIEISSEGVYVITGSAENATIIVDADSQDKVQIVLDGVSITNDDFPAIYVKSSDKVFVTTTDSDNTLTVTGTFTTDGENNTDAVIFSKDDIVLNGLGTLTIDSSDNGISGKDDIKITGGTINITCASDAIEAHDSIAIADGTITIDTEGDALKAEDDEDDSTGYIYICGGTIDIQAGDDGIHATTILQVDDGNITVNAVEGLEATYIQINGGNIDVTASDDGVNASAKSTAYDIVFEMNDGYLTVNMGQGDTDAIDSNGDLYVNGGTIDITAQSAFDYDGTGQYNGGTIIVNGVETNQISNQMMGGGMGGGMGGPGMDGGPGGDMGGGFGGPGMGGPGR